MREYLKMNDASELKSVITPEGEAKKLTNSSFFRGDHCNYYPNGDDQRNAEFCSHFLLKGLAPESRFVKENSRITAFGSCFASNISMHLERMNFDTAKKREPNIYISRIGEGLVNVYSILSQFQWALEGK